MREAINSNPLVQVAVIAVMAIVVAFLLFTRVLNQGGGEAAPSTAGTPAASESTAPASSGAAAVPPAPTAPGETAPSPGTAPATPAPAAPSTGAAAAGASAFIPGPGLPEDVVVAYARNKAVVLLITRSGGIDDRALRVSASRLRARGDVAFIHVPATKIADYARITEGLDVSRVPALVVIRPRKLTGNVPEASVSYGFRSPASIVQAVEDAAFDGKSATYDP